MVVVDDVAGGVEVSECAGNGEEEEEEEPLKFKL